MSGEAVVPRWSLSRPLRGVLYLAVGIQAVLLTAQVVLEFRLVGTASPPEGGLAAVLVGVVSIAVFPAVGLFLLHKRPENPVGWLFCTAMLGWTINNAVAPYVRLGTFVDPDVAPGAETVAWFFTWPGFLSTALTVLLLLVFPDGRLPSPRWQSWAVATVVSMTVAGIGAAFAPGPLDPSIRADVANPLGVAGPVGSVLRLVGELGYIAALILVVGAILAVIQRFRRSRGVERLQMKWFVSGVGVWAVLLAFFLLAALLYPTFQDLPLWAQVAQLGAILGGAVVPVTAAIGIVRYRLYDIDRVVSRTVSYGALTLVLVAVYGGGVVGLGSLVRAVTGGGGGDLVVAASTLAVAALFQPMRRRLQDLVDRRFNRARYDAIRTVETFAHGLRDQVDVDVLTAEVRDVARRTLQPTRASLWLPTEVRGS